MSRKIQVTNYKKVERTQLYFIVPKHSHKTFIENYYHFKWKLYNQPIIPIISFKTRMESNSHETDLFNLVKSLFNLNHY